MHNDHYCNRMCHVYPYLDLRDFTLGLSLGFQVGVYYLRKGHSRAVVKRDINVFILDPQEPHINQ